MQAVKSDLLDSSTYESPFQYKFPGGESISAVSGVSGPGPYMTAFVDLAAQKHNVKRFVLLTGSSTEIGEVYVGGPWNT